MGKKQIQTAQPRPIRDIHVPSDISAKKRSFKLWRTNPFKNLNRPKFKLAVAIGLMIVAGLLVRNYIQTRNELKKAADPQATVREEATELTKDIGKFLELPSSETPTLATVNDADKLKSQPFFKNAQNGDKLLVYSNASRAVLYRPSTKKVIEYMPIDLGAPPKN